MAVPNTVRMVKALVPVVTYNRAREIAASPKLGSLVFEGATLEKATALCAGTNAGDQYSVSVAITEEGGPVGQCSCPAQAKGGLCKHVVALLLRRVDELSRVQQPVSASSSLLAEENVGTDQKLGTPAQNIPAVDSVVKIRSVVDVGSIPSCPEEPEVLLKRPKRALPSWMLGVDKSTDSKSSAAAPGRKPGRVAALSKPPPPKRARTRAKIAGSVDDEDNEQSLEDCGDMENAKVMEARAEENGELEVADKRRSIRSRTSSGKRRGVKALAKETDVELHEEPLEIAGTGRTRRGGRARVATSEGTDDIPDGVGTEVISGDSGFELTADDLVTFAHKHLEDEHTSQVGEATEAHKEDRGHKETTEQPMRSFNILRELDNADGVSVASHRTSATGQKMGTRDKVADEMLGLFFGPLSMQAKANAESQDKAAHTNTVVHFQPEVLENAAPALPEEPPNVSYVPKTQPKKKSSLRDQVMLYLK